MVIQQNQLFERTASLITLKKHMSYEQLMYFHLVTVVPCFFIGVFLLLRKKGDPLHKNLGKVYSILMLITSIIALFMPARVGPQFFNHFGYIHLFCFLTLYMIPTAIIAVRKGNIKAHKRKMAFTYFGALVIAGSFTFVPGRFMYALFFA